MRRSNLIPSLVARKGMPHSTFAEIKTKTPETHPELWVTDAQAAEIMGVSLRTVQRRADAGDITIYRGPTANSGPNEARKRYLRDDCERYWTYHMDYLNS